MKSNYSAIGDDIEVTYREGLFVPISKPGGVLGAIDKRASQAAFLDCLDAIARQGRYVTDAPTSPARYAPKVFEGLSQARGARKRELEGAMRTLFDAGTIIVGYQLGDDRHQRRCIVRAE